MRNTVGASVGTLFTGIAGLYAMSVIKNGKKLLYCIQNTIYKSNFLTFTEKKKLSRCHI